jgi:site-specific DNA-cytosine methylase
MKHYTALFPFGGIGGGALGFSRASARLFGREASFKVIGGIDFDAPSCRDFTMLTGAPSLCADIATLTPAGLRLLAPECPDVVFLSPPCKGASGLLSAAKAKTAKYRAMNRLALRWLELMLATWEQRPKLILLENVPRLKQRAAGMLRRVRRLLKQAGYVFTDGFHECGELGGLAQVRRRYLLVARDPKQVPGLLYEPPKKRVRACGEVLAPMPLPGDPAGGPMHRLPKLSWLNWVRLALIPAGGDWRDLDDVLRDGQPRREVFRRHHVEKWTEPSVTIAGSGSNGPSAVADPRIPLDSCNPGRHHNKYRVEDWSEPARTVMGATRPGSGAPSVADPRIAVKAAFDHGYGVLSFNEPSPTVAGGSAPGQGAYSVADERFRGSYGVLEWDEPAGTITGNARPPTGKFSVADLRFGCEMRNGTYGVLSWQEAAASITGSACHDNGAFSVADPRKPPERLPIIIAADGTWHRPLTTLELAALQGFPTIVAGAPLKLDGDASGAWRERIGNAVPPPAAQAIAERMLVCLLQAELSGFSLASTDTPVWISPEEQHA